MANVSMTEDANNWFLLFNHLTLEPKTHVMERTIGFGNPSLFGLLNGKTYLHCDASFCDAPKPLYQILVMIPDWDMSSLREHVNKR